MALARVAWWIVSFRISTTRTASIQLAWSSSTKILKLRARNSHYKWASFIIFSNTSEYTNRQWIIILLLCNSLQIWDTGTLNDLFPWDLSSSDMFVFKQLAKNVSKRWERHSIVERIFVYSPTPSTIATVSRVWANGATNLSNMQTSRTTFFHSSLSAIR